MSEGGLHSSFTIPVVYGVGSGGSKLAAALVKGVAPGGRRILSTLPATEPACISSSRSDIERLRTYVDRHLFVIGDGTGSGMNPDKGRRDYLEHPSRREIIQLPARVAAERGMERIDLIPVIFTAGFGCGSGAGPALIQDLVKHYPNSCVLGICTLPFPWEGVETYRRAVKALEEACKHAPVIPASNSYLIQEMPDVDITRALNAVNERILKPLSTLFRAMSSGRSITDLDSSDLKRMLKGLILAMQWLLPSPDEIPNLSHHNSSSLVSVVRGRGNLGVVAFIEIGKGSLSPQHAAAIPGQLSAILGADIKEMKALLAKRPDAEKTSVTVLVGGAKLYV
jgi:cell division GTPase FtsZ